jgi:magnesium chelatase subunit I
MESSFDDSKAPKIIDDLIEKAVLNTFNHYCQPVLLEPVVIPFQRGLSVEVSEMLHSQFYLDMLKRLPTIERPLKALNIIESPEATASAVEFILEGLYTTKQISKTHLTNKRVYGK